MQTDWFYEGTNRAGTIEYIITFAEGEYIVDIFDANIVDNEQAYIDTFCFDSLNEAKTDFILYQYP